MDGLMPSDIISNSQIAFITLCIFFEDMYILLHSGASGRLKQRLSCYLRAVETVLSIFILHRSCDKIKLTNHGHQAFIVQLS